MEIKYCEHCGVMLGMVNPIKKYCSDCKRKVSTERKRAWRKALKTEAGFTPVRSTCQWCGEPMVKTSAVQKYHRECAKEANAISTAENQRLRKERDRNKKASKNKKIPSVGQVQSLADKLGKHYGEVSRMLASGELVYEW